MVSVKSSTFVLIFTALCIDKLMTAMHHLDIVFQYKCACVCMCLYTRLGVCLCLFVAYLSSHTCSNASYMYRIFQMKCLSFKPFSLHFHAYTMNLNSGVCSPDDAHNVNVCRGLSILSVSSGLIYISSYT